MIAYSKGVLDLAQDEVQVWSVSLKLEKADLEDLHQTLDEHERYRASQFFFSRDRHQFIAAHGILRQILSKYLRVPPGEIQICPNVFGRPELKHHPRTRNGTRNKDVRFSYSHSHELAVFAFARNIEVGIDVEWIEPKIVDDSIPELFFTQREAAAIRRLPSKFQPQAFFNCWTRKEAYVKARGEGLRIPLNSFDVSSDLVTTEHEGSIWSLQSFVPAHGYTAALVAQGQDLHTRFIDVDEYHFHRPEVLPCFTCLDQSNC